MYGLCFGPVEVFVMLASQFLAKQQVHEVGVSTRRRFQQDQTQAVIEVSATSA